MNHIFHINVFQKQPVFLLLFSILSFLSCNHREKISDGTIMAQVIERPVKNDIAADSGTMVTATEIADSVNKTAVKVKTKPPAPVAKPKPKSMPPPATPKSMPPPKTSAPPSGGSSQPKEFEGMGAPQPNEEIQFIPQAPKGIRNPVGPGTKIKKPSPKTK